MTKVKTKAELILLCFLLGVCGALLQKPMLVPKMANLNFSVGSFAPTLPTVSDHGIVTVTTHDDLDKIFNQQAYDLDQVSNGQEKVPAIFLTSLPQDLHLIDQPQDKKDLFIRAVLPLVLLVNDHIREQRAQLLRIWNKQLAGIAPTPSEAQFIADLSKEYQVYDQDMSALAKRVDVIPPSLAIAQAAEESGWGTSRFARDGNSLFGQQVYDADAGLMPTDRAQGKHHLVRGFDNLFETVLSYSRNLNSHNAYSAFREARAQLRKDGQYIDSLRLVNALESYSERRGDYVRTIKRIITSNDLQSLDGARLQAENTAYWRQRFI